VLDLDAELIDRRGSMGLLVRKRLRSSPSAYPFLDEPDEADSLAEIPQSGRSHPPISSRQDVLDGNGRQLHE
jgi:hypothetical protein